MPKEITVPASKSHTIRALLIAAAAEGVSEILTPLVSEDSKSCVSAVRQMGAEVTMEELRWIVKGTGGKFFINAGNGQEAVVDTGNSGTTLYLAAGFAALSDRAVTFTGDDQIQTRPAGNLLKSLSDLGASVAYKNKKGYPPFTVHGPITGGSTSLECPTSQYLSSLLLCAPLSFRETVIEVPLLREQPYVEMTLRWLDEQHIEYKNNDFKQFIIPGGQKYRSFKKQVPGDFSSATFFLCAAAITRSTVILRGLDMRDSQGDKAVVTMLEKMGCRVETGKDFVRIEGRYLKGSIFDLNNTPDALPALAVTACFAEGETRLINVPQARLKETDRIAVMALELSKMGADIKELPDGLIIRGKKGGSKTIIGSGSFLKGARVSGHGDHRVIMSLAIAALRAEGETTIDDDSAVGVTFPRFFDLLDTDSE